jgi:hypothetical protein
MSKDWYQSSLPIELIIPETTIAYASVAVAITVFVNYVPVPNMGIMDIVVRDYLPPHFWIVFIIE